MAYTDIDKSDDYFQTVLYTGDDANNRQISVNFSPDLTWIKVRNESYGHMWFDRIRGIAFTFSSQTTNASTDRTGIGWTNSGCTTDSFTVDRGSNESLNETGRPFVAWNWLGGGTGVSNTDGTISSTVSASTTSGFSIVSYTGNGSSSATVGHGLGTTPSMIICKSRSNGTNWAVYHKSLAANNGMALNSTLASDTVATFSDGLLGTSPTSSTFGFIAGSGGLPSINTNAYTYIAYCFADVKGFSKAFSYTGNGSADGVFTYCGFKPAFLLVKSTGADNWCMLDNKRDTFNVMDKRLFPNLSNAESTGVPAVVDFVSNGFKLRTSDSSFNLNGQSFIGIAFAENPFVTSTSIPTTAR
jgi:hypothetical protein